MTLLACRGLLSGEPRFERGGAALHRTACLLEIHGLEFGRRAPGRPKMPLGYLNKVKQRVSVRIGRGQRRRERTFECGEGACQMTPMVGRVRRRAQVSHAFGRLAERVVGAPAEV